MSGLRFPLGRAHSGLLVGGAALVFGLAGCGGGSGDFKTQADQICRSTEAKEKKVAAPTSASQISAYITRELPVAEQGLSKLKGLTPPSSQKSVYGSYLSNLDQEVSLLSQAGAKAKSGKVKASISLADQAGSLDSQSNTMAKTLGLTGCSSG